MLSATFLTYHT